MSNPSRAGLPRNPVPAALMALGLVAALGLSLLSHAPNRLLSGRGIALIELAPALLMLPALLLALAIVSPPTRGWQALSALGQVVLLLALTWLAGDAAARLAQASALARTSLGAGFWVLAATCLLALADAVQGWRALVAAAALALGLALLLAGGSLDQLALLKEYANRQEQFQAALLRHLQIVAATLLPALAVGLPLGVAAARSRRLGRWLFPLLNLIQTIPSLALFALLIAPLALLAAAWPALGRWGLAGVGLAPAVLALVLYSLLPITRSTAAGLQQVPAAVRDSARAMGMTAAQIFWRVELPLALPLLLAGLRVSTVQTVGLAVVAALIGAGGLGSLIFQGLLSSAADLVLLGVLPVLALGLLSDAAFKGLGRLLEAR